MSIVISDYITKSSSAGIPITSNTLINVAGIPYDSWQFFLYLPVTADIANITIANTVYNLVRGFYQVALRMTNNVLESKVFTYYTTTGSIGEEEPITREECFRRAQAIGGAIGAAVLAGVLGVGVAAVIYISAAIVSGGLLVVGAIPVAIAGFVTAAVLGGVGGAAIGLGIASLIAEATCPPE